MLTSGSVSCRMVWMWTVLTSGSVGCRMVWMLWPMRRGRGVDSAVPL